MTRWKTDKWNGLTIRIYSADDEEEPKEEKPKRYCITCGKPLGQYKQIYCSIECSRQKRKELLNSLKPVKHCAICGKPLPSGRQKFCSLECRKKNETMKKLESNYSAREEERKAEREWLRKMEEKEKQIKARRKVTMTFEEIEKGMLETGLSYGEYVARYDK